MPSIPVALTIAGSDSGGGAGIQADILTFAACGAYATSAITCLTAQNPDGVSGVHAAPGAFVREQADQVAKFFPVGAVKTGMLFNADIIGAVAGFLAAYPAIPYILDPVMIATSGARLLDEAALAALREKLVPRAALVTPNLDEAAVFLGYRPSGLSLTQKDDALALAKKLGVPVLLKGGHASSKNLIDVFATPAGDTLVLNTERRDDIDTHGSGCTLAAAIAAFVAAGRPLREAVADAHDYLRRGIATGISVDGKSYIAHLKPDTTPDPAPYVDPDAGATTLRVQNRPAVVVEKPDPETDTTALLRKYTAPEPSLRPPPLPDAPFWETVTGAGLLKWLKFNLKVILGATVLHMIGLDGFLWNLVCLGVLVCLIKTLNWVRTE